MSKKVTHYTSHQIATQVTKADGGKRPLNRGEVLRILLAIKKLDVDLRIGRWLRDNRKKVVKKVVSKK